MSTPSDILITTTHTVQIQDGGSMLMVSASGTAVVLE
jgi:uncharacterized protein YbjQ (UPF0145 family)